MADLRVARKHRERGSALMLVPAGIFVLLMLGAIAVDAAIAFSAQRELENTAAAVANDVVTLAIPAGRLQLGVDARPDPQEVDRLVHEGLDGTTVGGSVLRPEDIAVVTDEAAGTVTITLQSEVDYLFSPAIPGAKRSAHVTGTATAALQFRGPQ